METPGPVGGSPPAPWRRALWPVFLVLLVLAVYAPSLSNGFVYDDGVLIVTVDAPHSLGEIVRVFGERHWKGLPYYRPIPRATMLAQKYWHGNKPAPYHLFNVIVMALTALAGYGLLRQPVFGLTRPAAFLGAALFAVHPVASSTVHPIASGRETLIPALFVLLALWAYLRSGLTAQLLAPLFFLLALLSKEQAIVVPLLFLLADVLGLPARPARRAGNWTRHYAPLVAIVLGYLALRVSLFGGTGEHRFVLHERPLGPLESLLYSLQSVFNPPTHLVYEPPFEMWFSVAHLAVVLVAVAALAVWSARHWAGARPRALFWTGWFLLAIAPTANVLHQEARFDERYVFLASLGVIGLALAVAGVSWERPSFRGKAVIVGVLLIVVCSGYSFYRADFYRDELTFLAQWVRSAPTSAKAHHGLGQYYVGAGDLSLAREHFERAVQLQPTYAAAHNNLGSLLALQGEPERATHHFRQALQLDPQHALAYNNLASQLEIRGELDEAESLFLQSLAIEPQSVSVHVALGQLYLRRKEPQKAMEHFDRALRLDPNQARVHVAMGRMWLEQGDRRRAEFHFDRAVLLEPGNAPAQNNLGMLLALRKEMALAKLHFEGALKADPNYVEAHLNYANMLFFEGDVEGGRRHVAEALRIDPASAAARERQEAIEKALEEQKRRPS